MGRPVIYTDKIKSQLLEKLEKYIDETNVPIIAEFCTIHKVRKQRLYEWEEFTDMLGLCTQKKEANLEKLALAGKINTSMAIFSLKQLGWTDLQKVEHSGAVKIVDDIK